MEPSRKTVVNKELDSYITRMRRRKFRESLCGIFKREKPVKEEEEPDPEVSEELSEAIRKNYPSQNIYSRIKGVFKPKKGAEMSQEMGSEETVESANDAEFEKELNELDEAEAKEENSLGFFAGIKNFFTKPRGYNVPGEEDLEKADSQTVTKIVLERPEIEKDIKKIALVTQSILQSLPEEKLKEFKKSDDFIIYKDVLSKYDLIKK